MPTSQEGLVVQSPQHVVKACRREVRQVLSNPAYELTEVLASRAGYHYSLTGPGATEAKADRNYKVVPFLETDLYPYWVALLLKFIPIKTQFRLSDISIVLFRGPATDEQKEPLLRAEWGCISTYDNENHAQPHWHAYPEGRESFLLSRNQLDLAQQVMEFGAEVEAETVFGGEEELRERFSRLHLAMAARWHHGNAAAHRLALAEEEVPSWIGGCLQYLKSQLLYVFGR